MLGDFKILSRNFIIFYQNYFLSLNTFIWKHRFLVFKKILLLVIFEVSIFSKKSFIFLSLRGWHNSYLLIMRNLTFKWFVFQRNVPKLWSSHNCLFQNFVHEKSSICSNITFFNRSVFSTVLTTISRLEATILDLINSLSRLFLTLSLEKLCNRDIELQKALSLLNKLLKLSISFCKNQICQSQ